MTDTDVGAGVSLVARECRSQSLTVLQANTCFSSFSPQLSVPREFREGKEKTAQFSRLCMGWGGCLMLQSSLYPLTLKTLLLLKLHKQSYY